MTSINNREEQESGEQNSSWKHFTNKLNKSKILHWVLIAFFFAFFESLFYFAHDATLKQLADPSILWFISGGFFVSVWLIYRIVDFREKKVNNIGFFRIWSIIFVQLSLTVFIEKQFPASIQCHQGYFLFVPYLLAPMLLTLISGRSIGCFGVVACSLLGMLLTAKEYSSAYLVIMLLAGVLTVLLSYKARTRNKLLAMGFYVSLLIMSLLFIFRVLPFNINEYQNFKEIGFLCFAGFVYPIILVSVIGGSMPWIEAYMGKTTILSWLEMNDMNHPLLKQLMEEAPGTHAHSLAVANLARSAAEAIGANSQECYVMALFHDVGKLDQPNYFTENMSDQNNSPHKLMDPVTSAQIILNHVKYGVELAKIHKLNSRIIDGIREHHGKTLVKGFYLKAIQEAEKSKQNELEGRLQDDPKIVVDPEKFRYAGPKPQTKETAILSLADPIQSASVSSLSSEASPEEINQLVKKIVFGRIDEYELEESPLTLSDIKIICESFTKTVISTHHKRCEYLARTIRPDEKISSSKEIEESEGKGANLPENKKVSNSENSETKLSQDASSENEQSLPPALKEVNAKIPLKEGKETQEESK